MDAGHLDTVRADPVDELPLRRGDAIGRFTVLQSLGAGGMGVVVSAYDCSLDRKVAIKVLRPDRQAADPEQGRSRLLREAQAMARLSHPNVITVHEVGTVGDQVFVAMELVDGDTLAGWLSDAPRSWREVVGTFVAAGRGLVAAHEAGLVHRDFKPDNVLVGTDGGVRVTDFGLAGVSADSPAPVAAVLLAAPLTRTGTVLGTPAYMSPEQHRGEEADARSDQFSFCVALHEALYGVRPFAGLTAAEVLDAIVAGRLSAPIKEAPRWLRPIVLRGLQARREDRWPSMTALLDALSRDPSAVRRRLLGGGAAIIAATAVATAMFLARDRPALCQGAAAEAATVWNPTARQRVRAAFQATGSPIAADVFDRVDRLMTKNLAGWAAAHSEACRATHVRGEQSEAMLDLRMQCLERARRQIGSLVEVWTGTKVNLEKAIGAASSMGDVTACADTEALAMPVAPPRDPALARQIDAVRATIDRARAQSFAGQPKAALSLAREALAAARPLGYAPVLAEALQRSGDMECEVGQLEVGVPLLYEAVRVAAEARDDVFSARILIGLLSDLTDKGKKLEEAARVMTFAEMAVARAGNREDLVHKLLLRRSALLYEQGRQEEALALLQRALPLLEKQVGPDHLDVAVLLHDIAFQLSALGRNEEALPLYRRAVAIRERIFGPDHPVVANTLNNLISVLADRGQHDEANRHAERALAIRERAYPPGHRMIATSLLNLGALRMDVGRFDEARVLLERAEKMRAAALGAHHPDTAMVRHNLAEVAILGHGDTATARRLLESAIADETRAFGEDHPLIAHAWRTMGMALLEDENWKGAEAAYRRAAAMWRKQSKDSGDLWDALVGLGRAHIGQGRHAEAIAELEDARARDERVRGPKSRYRDDILIPLGVAYLGAGRIDLAVRTLETGVALAESDPTAAPHLSMSRFRLARAHWARGESVRALSLARAARDALARPHDRRHRERIEAWLRAHERRAHH